VTRGLGPLQCHHPEGQRRKGSNTPSIDPASRPHFRSGYTQMLARRTTSLLSWLSPVSKGADIAGYAPCGIVPMQRAQLTVLCGARFDSLLPA